jgi:hypothetical protein
MLAGADWALWHWSGATNLKAMDRLCSEYEPRNATGHLQASAMLATGWVNGLDGGREIDNANVAQTRDSSG